eukprot:scaffold676672_cov48-Prasinocladus_malaysianus.AAC.1
MDDSIRFFRDNKAAPAPVDPKGHSKNRKRTSFSPKLSLFPWAHDVCDDWYCLLGVRSKGRFEWKAREGSRHRAATGSGRTLSARSRLQDGARARHHNEVDPKSPYKFVSPAKAAKGGSPPLSL